MIAKRILSKSLWISVVLIFGISCQKDENNPLLPTSVKTINSTVYPNGGVLLEGEISNLGNDEITAYGFELFASGNNVHYNVNHHVELPAKRGKFTLDIKQGLYPDLEYTYRAFARSTDWDESKGESMTFISRGSLTPVISEVVPNVAHINDTVALIGNNFPIDKSRIELKFGDSFSQIISAVADTILFRVPKPNTTSRIIELNAFHKTVSKSGILSLHSPLITGVQPETAFFGDTIVIKGEHFEDIVNFSRVHIGGIQAEILNTNRNEIVAIVPDEVNYDNTTIEVYAQLQNVDYNGFALSLPSITEVPEYIYNDEYFEFKVGQTYPNHRNFWIGDYESSYSEILDNETVKIYLPHATMYSERSNFIKWNINGAEVLSPTKVYVANPFLKIGRAYHEMPFNEYVAFTKNGKGYVLGNTVTSSDAKGFIYEYNRVANRWTEKALVHNDENPVAFRAFFGVYTFSSYDNAIYGLRKGGHEFDFIRINSATGFHEELTPFPTSNNYATGFTHGNKVYFTGGPGLDQIWSYNIDSDSWEMVTTLPFVSHRGGDYNAIVVDNYVYIANGQDGSAYADFWRMDFNNFQWERLADNPFPIKKATVYKFKEELHFVSDEVWKYDYINNTWEIMEKDGILTDTRIGRLGSFLHNGIPYVLEDTSTSFQKFLNLYEGDLVE